MYTPIVSVPSGMRSARHLMRIVVASPPKSGNHWIKCLLAEIYDLSVVEGERKERITAESLPGWVEGHFPDGSIIHIHNRCTTRLCDAIDAVPAHLVTIVRDPYDVFVSLYHWTQQRAGRGLDRRQGRPRQAMVGKAIDDPDVLDFLAEEFAANIEQANGWLHGGRAHVVHYEALHADPQGELTRLANAIDPMSPGHIAAAIDACRADKMRQASEKMAWHIRSAKVGDSREMLRPAHLEIFRQRHAAGIRSLGYCVR
jgi:hypothetical protein